MTIVNPTDPGPEALPQPTLSRAPAGDFDRFFRAEYPSLVTVGVAMTGDRQAAEDVAQETMLRAHRDWATVSRLERPGAWTRRVAINLLHTWGRRRGIEHRALGRLHARPAAGAAPTSSDTARFWELVRELPERQRAAVALHYLDDLSVADLADALGCAEGTAKAHLHKARANLARRLQEDS